MDEYVRDCYRDMPRQLDSKQGLGFRVWGGGGVIPYFGGPSKCYALGVLY